MTGTSTASEAGDTPAGGPTSQFWRYGRALLAPILIWALLVGSLGQLAWGWLGGERHYDEAAMQEWLEEARNADSTLADLVAEYQRRAREERSAHEVGGVGALDAGQRVLIKREEIYQHLRALGEPATKMYPGQLPLFPVIYRLEVHLAPLVPGEEPPSPVIWDSGQEPSSGQYRESPFALRKEGRVLVRYQLRAWNKRKRDEVEGTRRVRLLMLLAVAATVLALAWLLLLQADKREHDRQRRLARERIDQAERQRLDEERRRVETERQLLEQMLARKAAEQKALELKSQLYASIGIMAGSYAHNIKNLLVRPNDLLRRCLERADTPTEVERMLLEVRQTLGMVTERLQQILHTVRRDPSQSELRVLDLNDVIRTLGQTWKDLAGDRWQLDMQLDLCPEALPVEGDESHLQQAVENLLFNARDATFEMRNHQREQARKTEDPSARKQALIQAAGWRGKVLVRTRRLPDGVGIVEVTDNGAGMTEAVRQRCTETHFSTKRDNALYAGHSTGMGLGLSFVVAILDNHRAQLEIDSRPLGGTTFRARFCTAEVAER